MGSVCCLWRFPVSLPPPGHDDGWDISFSRACILKNIMIVAHFQTTSACVGVPEIRIKYLVFVWLPSIVLSSQVIENLLYLLF